MQHQRHHLKREQQPVQWQQQPLAPPSSVVSRIARRLSSESFSWVALRVVLLLSAGVLSLVAVQAALGLRESPRNAAKGAFETHKDSNPERGPFWKAEESRQKTMIRDEAEGLRNQTGAWVLEREGTQGKGGSADDAESTARERHQVSGHAESPQRNKDDRTEVLKMCDDLQTMYGITPEEDWGSAPKHVQDKWERTKCDMVLGDGTFSLDDPPSRGRQRAVVVVWDNIRGWLEFLRPPFVRAGREECRTECVWTSDRGKLERADGVLFHAPTHVRKELPTWKKPDNVQYILLNLEPVTYSKIRPLLGDKNYMSMFDLTMTYERTSDIPLGYVSDSPASRYFSAKNSFEEKDGFGSPSAIAAFASNCKGSGATVRTEYMSQLMQYATVHSFGKCLHNRDEPKLVDGEGTSVRQQNKIEVLRRYKFYMAFENNNKLRDYVTEKVYNGLQAGTLPVYWGAENIEDYVPRGSVVQARDFASPQALAEHLQVLSQDEETYEAYFQWRGNSTEAERFQEEVVGHSAYGVNAMCRLCERLVRDRQAKESGESL